MRIPKNTLAYVAAFFLLAYLFSCSGSANSGKAINNRGEQLVASANLYSTADENLNVGKALFYSLPDKQIRMDLEIDMKSRADSNVAVHFHEHGDCGNKGNNTHGHWNPTNENHGKWGTPPFHSGDIGNIKLDKKGHAVISIITDKWSVIENDKNSIISRGIIVHSGTDDYTTQPTGNSGPRIGCGVIIKK